MPTANSTYISKVTVPATANDNDSHANWTAIVRLATYMRRGVDLTTVLEVGITYLAKTTDDLLRQEGINSNHEALATAPLVLTERLGERFRLAARLGVLDDQEADDLQILLILAIMAGAWGNQLDPEYGNFAAQARKLRGWRPGYGTVRSAIATPRTVEEIVRRTIAAYLFSLQHWE